MKDRVFFTNKLHDRRGKGHDRNHDRKHGKVTDSFPDGIKRFAYSGRRQDLANTRSDVALDCVLHQVEPSERKKRGNQQGHEAAEIRRIVEAPMTVNLHGSIRRMVRRDEKIGDIKRHSESNQKAITTRPLKEISPRQVIKSAQRFHFVSPGLPEIQYK